MAEKRPVSSGKKKTAAKKGTSAAAKRKPAQSQHGRGAASRRMTAESIRQRNQMRAVVLFACAIFLACLVLIPGDNLWKWAHGAFLGVFGSWALLWPVLIIYVAIVTALDNPKGSISGKIWMTALIIILFCAAGYVFGASLPAPGMKLWDYIVSLYYQNSGIGGGVVGGMLGLPLVKAVGGIGAKIIVILLLFVAVMLLTGTTLISLFRTIKKPVDVVSEGLQNARQRREEERLILEEDRAANIDIPLEPRSASAAAVSSEAARLFPKAEPKRKKKEKNEKLDKLGEVFGFEDPPLDLPVETPALPPEMNRSVENAASEATAKASEATVSTVEQNAAVTAAAELNSAMETIWAEADVTAGASAEADASQPHRETALGSAEEPAVPDEVQELTQDFMKKKEENDRREASSEQQALYQAAEEMKTVYCYPPVTMLAASPFSDPAQETEELQTNGRILVETLKSFGVQTKILDICRGPSVTRYEIQPAAGVKISKITNLSDDLALNLAATGVRIEAPIPGKAAVGIEVPNKTRNTVRMRELIESNSFQTSKGKLSVALGRDIAGQPVVADLSKMPHLLIAGTTGSGKSVCINSLIISMLYKASPDEVRFLMIDPKAVELTEYNGMPHMLVPVVTDPRKASGALGWAVSEMMNRYKIFSEFNVRNLKGYNSLAESQNFQDENGQPMPAMPQIVIIIDELADLMMAAPKEVEDSICRLAQLARAAGMHLVVATQRPSVDVVTGLIKANIPSRIALTVSNSVDSRTILDAGGAEKLLGNGDMLFSPVGANKPVRVQGCYVSDDEISSIVEFVKKTKTIEYDEAVIQEIERNAASEGEKGDTQDSDGGSSDPMMDEAIKCVIEAGQASTSLLQRRLRLGYARAGRLIDEMEQLGIVGPHEGSKPRQVLMTYAQWAEMHMQKADPAQAEALDDE